VTLLAEILTIAANLASASGTISPAGERSAVGIAVRAEIRKSNTGKRSLSRNNRRSRDRVKPSVPELGRDHRSCRDLEPEDSLRVSSRLAANARSALFRRAPVREIQLQLNRERYSGCEGRLFRK